MKFNKKSKTFVYTHTEIQQQVRRYLKILRVKVWHNRQGLGCYRGLPDLEGVYKGQHYYVEIKAGKDKLSQYQEAFKSAVEEEREKVFVVWSLQEFLNEWEAWNKLIHGEETK